MSMKEATIRINNLSIGYRSKNDTRLVASNITTTIYSGELTCLLGANGVGKSTLLRTLSAFQPRLSGEIALLGHDIQDYSDKELSTIVGVVLTDKCDIRNMSVRELIEMGRSPYTGFWDAWERKTSGWWKRRSPSSASKTWLPGWCTPSPTGSGKR